MGKLKNGLIAAAAWVHSHAAFLFLIATGSLLGATLFRRKDNMVNTVSAARAVERELDAIKSIAAQRDALAPEDAERANQVLKLSADIERHKKRIAELHGGRPWEEMSDDEVRRALADVGL